MTANVNPFLDPNKYGVSVECVRCHRTKAPRGRSVAIEMASAMCHSDCDGYNLPPHVGSLWPMESEADFGYAVGTIGTRMLK